MEETNSKIGMDEVRKIIGMKNLQTEQTAKIVESIKEFVLLIKMLNQQDSSK